MDDILKERKRQHAEKELGDINKLHPNLKFIEECENDQQQLPVLDMKIHHDHENGTLSSTWYNKPTDTGLIMNYHALAPKRYKRSVVSGFVYRIHRACSTTENFQTSLDKARRILEQNQYPPTFYEPIIRQAMKDILEIPPEQTSPPPAQTENSTEKRRIMIQYRGKSTEDYARSLHKINAPCTIVMTLRKLKTVLPSLKPPVEKLMKSGVVYHLSCPRCPARYVGQTDRHMQTRLYEHNHKAGPLKTHLQKCGATLTGDHVEILHATSRGESYLLTLEALYIRERKPTLNTKDEYKRRELVIKL